MSLGIDVSRWQTVTNWSAVTAEFVYVKIGDGKAGSVLRLEHVAGARGAGKPVGGYWFARNNEVSPEDQARAFAAVLRSTGALDLPAMLDLEGSGGFQVGGWAVDFGKRFLTKLIAEGIRRVGIYTGEWMATQLKPWDWGFPGLFLWIANYSKRPVCPHHIWQKSDTGRMPGITENVDINESFVPLEAAMAWRVANSLNALLNQINARYPGRNKASDGSIGDAAHASRDSDHNPWVRDGSMGVVTARDFTHDPARGVDIARLVQELAASRDSRIKYIIANHKILSGAGGPSPWVWRNYTGSNPHTKHFHLSVVSSKNLYDDARKWNLPSLGGTPINNPEDDMPSVDDILNGKVGERPDGSYVSLKDAVVNPYLNLFFTKAGWDQSKLDALVSKVTALAGLVAQQGNVTAQEIADALRVGLVADLAGPLGEALGEVLGDDFSQETADAVLEKIARKLSPDAEAPEQA